MISTAFEDHRNGGLLHGGHLLEIHVVEAVENLVFDASCSLEVKASKATDCGMLAGLVYDATVRDITSGAPMHFARQAARLSNNTTENNQQ